MSLPSFDFETYSEAGFVWDPARNRWAKPIGATKYGLQVVGATAYVQHPTFELLSLAYDLKDGRGERRWKPGNPWKPQDLIDHVAAGRPLEAHNAEFEYLVWLYYCGPVLGWGELSIWQLYDSAAKARASAYPGALGNLGRVLGIEHEKDKDGDRLLKKFSMPRNPTKKDRRTRIRPEEDPEDAAKLYDYNGGDIVAESEASEKLPELPPEELEFWRLTLAMNVRGVGVDLRAVDDCIEVLHQAQQRYDVELYDLTGGAVEAGSQIKRLSEWLSSRGVHVSGLDGDAVDELLARRPPVPPDVRRALEIRQLVGSAGVKKLYAMKRQAARGDRLHGLFIYHGARTGRDTGADVQPQNLVKSGPSLVACSDGCSKMYGPHLAACPYCGQQKPVDAKVRKWAEVGVEAIDDVLRAMSARSLDWIEYLYGDALLAISGCIRGMFVAAPGHDLIASDYSAIEAVVTAMMAGEQWRIEAFERGEPIYLLSASDITGISVAEYERHKAETGSHHPDRQKLGKVAELGLGFGGWVGAWRQFDDSDNFTDEEVKQIILKWRDASPAIVELWGGQVRGKPWAPDYPELYGLEGAAIAAVSNPGQAYRYGLVTYQMHGDALFALLPSGRRLTYHEPRLAPSTKWPGQVQLSFMGWNTNPKVGPRGWIRINTYGGRLTENAVQAVARDFLRDAVIRLERAGYPCVLRVHDEIVAEVPEGWGSIEEFERIMSESPTWAPGWPVRAAGGWRGKRYRKD